MTKRKNQRCCGVFMLIAVIFLSASPTPVHADIYKYIDGNGVMHFTNAPTSAGYKLYLKERPKFSGLSSDTHKYDPLITAASKKYGISFSLLKAMIKAESGYNPQAVSSKGAMGLMQIMPATSRELKIQDVFDPFENIMGGAQYFKTLYRRFDGKLPLALAAYNAGPSAVDQYQRIPPFRETEEYVKKVMQYYYTFKRNGRL